MLSAILKSETAINISIKIVRKFIQMRYTISNNLLLQQQFEILQKRQLTFEISTDNYINDSTLTLFHRNQNVSVTIYTHSISKSLKLDLEKYNQQYKPVEIKINKNFHDRFLIIDDKEIYLIGASLKDLGKKVFGFSSLKDIDVNFYKEFNS